MDKVHSLSVQSGVCGTVTMRFMGRKQIDYKPETYKKRPVVLAVETSGRLGSVAIGIGDEILTQINFTGPMRHSAELFPAVQQLLARLGRAANQINQIYISAGPGSFTGIRIAVTMAKSMHLAGAAKIVAVNSLDVIAANITDYIAQMHASISKIGTILDAKRSRFYAAVFDVKNGQPTKIIPDYIAGAADFVEEFANPSQPIWLLGEGLLYHSEKFKADGTNILPQQYWQPKAEKVYELGRKMASAGQFADPVTIQPLYLRRPEAEENLQKNQNNANL